MLEKGEGHDHVVCTFDIDDDLDALAVHMGYEQSLLAQMGKRRSRERPLRLR